MKKLIVNTDQWTRRTSKNGYKPVLKDMKDSETFRRTPNQVLLISSFNIFKDLLSECNGVNMTCWKNVK